MFKKKKETMGFVLEENYVPASLPKYGLNLDGYITGEYSLNLDSFIAQCYKECEVKFEELIQTSDSFTLGDSLDSFLDGQLAHIESRHQYDVANHRLQIEHIRSAIAVRKNTLEQRKAILEKSIQEKRKEIEPLQGLNAQYEIKIGKWYLQLGAIITLIAVIVDSLLNFSFLEGIILSDGFLLLVTVLGLSVLSDGSMFCLGTILSHRKEKYMSKGLYYTAVAGLSIMFLISAFACVFIKWGSMDITYGTINAAGEFLKKESYSLAEYAATVATSAITSCTGLISLLFSVDENVHLVKRRRKLEKALKKDIAEYEPIEVELEALEHAVDPIIYDDEKRQAAEANLEALKIGVKLHVRKLLALHQRDAAYTDSISESAKILLENEKKEEKAKTTVPFYHELKMKEAI